VTTAPPIPPQLKRKDAAEQLGQSAIGSARLRLWLWRVTSQYGWFFLILKVFLVLALLGWLGALPPLWHTMVVGGFVIAAVSSFWRATRNFKGVSEQEARRAVERASALPHRPLTSLTDTPATPNPLWRIHRDTLALNLMKVKFRRPDFSGLRLNYSTLRITSWIVLIAALLIAWDDAPRRLRLAAAPQVEALLPHAVLDVWVSPPEYTGQPAFALAAEQGSASIPEGSTLNIRVTGGWFTPKVVWPDGTVKLTAEGEESYVATLAVKTPGELAVKQDGRTLASWQLRLLVDTPPQISFAKPPSKTDQDALRLDYTAIDDVGLSKLTAMLEPGTIAAEAPEATPLVLDLPLRQPPPQEATGFRFFDLTENPWSGTEVLITFTATDSKGQSAQSETKPFTLPERKFKNPIAKALIKMRKELTTRGMAARPELLSALNKLAGEAEDNYVGDWVGALALRVMMARLQLGPDPEKVAGLTRLMWDTALHFEDGGSQQSLRHLREAQQALEDALDKGADQAELNQLMQELQQALREHLDDLAQQQEQMPQEGDEQQQQESVTRDQLEQFLEQLQQMMENGQTEQAQQMLKQLQELMENLQNGQSGPKDEQLEQALRELEEIERQQREMTGQTEKNCENPGASGQPGDSQKQGQKPGQQGQPGEQQQAQPQPGENGQPGGQSQSGQDSQQSENEKGNGGGEGLQQSIPDLPLPGAQGELRDRLGSVIQEFNARGLETGEFEQGEDAMGRAEDKLFERDGQGALREQKQALEHLRQGMNDMQEQMAKGQQPRDPNSDPLGRKKGSTGSDTSKIEIPEQQDIDRARKVLEELRRRAGEYNRPQDERDYLDRLLKLF
jgi:uncharacterized protein (TIGR02302 family)